MENPNESDIFYDENNFKNSHYSHFYDYNSSRITHNSISFKEISKKKNKAIKIDIKRSKSLDKIDNNFHFSFKGIINKEYESFLDENTV